MKTRQVPFSHRELLAFEASRETDRRLCGVRRCDVRRCGMRKPSRSFDLKRSTANSTRGCDQLALMRVSLQFDDGWRVSPQRHAGGTHRPPCWSVDRLPSRGSQRRRRFTWAGGQGDNRRSHRKSDRRKSDRQNAASDERSMTP